MSEDIPSPNGSNGRFAKGNAGGPGNPYARRVARLRGLLLDAVTDEDLKAIVAALVGKARAGDLAAAREVLTRTIGRADTAPDPDRLDVAAQVIEWEAIVTAKKCRQNRPTRAELVLDEQRVAATATLRPAT